MKITQTGIQNFIQTLKNKQTKVILLYGNEEVIILDIFTQIKKSLLEYIPITIDTSSSDYTLHIKNELFTQSMFGENKLIFVENYSKTDYRKIDDILEKIDEKTDSILVLTNNSSLEATNSIRKTCESNPLFASIGIYSETNSSIKQIAKETFTKFNIIHKPDVIEEISRMFTGNSVEMKQEIEKLSLYANKEEVTIEMLHKVVQGNSYENIFDLPIILLDKKLQDSLRIIQNAQNQETSPIVVFSAISSYVKKIYNIKQGLKKESFEILCKKNSIFFTQVGAVRKHVETISMKDITNLIESINILEIHTRNSVNMAYNFLLNFAANQCKES